MMHKSCAGAGIAQKVLAPLAVMALFCGLLVGAACPAPSFAQTHDEAIELLEEAPIEVKEPAVEETTQTTDETEGVITQSGDPYDKGQSYYFELSDPTDHRTAALTVVGVTEGSVSYNASSKTLKLDNAEIMGDITTTIDIKIKLIGANTIAGYDQFDVDEDWDDDDNPIFHTVWYDGWDYDQAAIDSTGSVTFTGPGSLTAEENICCKKLSIGSGFLVGRVRCKSLVVTGSGIIDARNPLKNTKNTGIQCTTFTMKGGSIVVGGYSLGVKCTKFNATVGDITITTPTPSKNYAIKATTMSNDPGCLRKIAGLLPKGAKFKVGGNVYQVSKVSNKGTSTAKVQSYGSSQTSFAFSDVAYGSRTYRVNGVTAKAFRTKRGAQLRSLAFKYSLSALGSHAFDGTSALTKLTLRKGLTGVTVAKANGKPTIKVLDGYTYASTAFDNAGKNGGKGLSVLVPVDSSALPIYRSYLIKKGLSTDARVLSCLS